MQLKGSFDRMGETIKVPLFYGSFDVFLVYYKIARCEDGL